MRFFKRLIFLAAIIIASGCATPPGGFKLDADSIEQATDAVVQEFAVLYQAGKLNKAQAQAIIDGANAIYAGAEASRSSAATGDKATEAAQLRAAADALDSLTARLAAKKGS